MAAAEPNPSLVERLFAEHRGALRTFFLRRIRGALERRQASSIDIEEAPADEQLETLPAFDGDLDAAQRALRLGAVLKQLRPKCRAAMELRFMHELRYREIAMHLGVSPQMAKKYVAQGLSHCRLRMAGLG